MRSFWERRSPRRSSELVMVRWTLAPIAFFTLNAGHAAPVSGWL